MKLKDYLKSVDEIEDDEKFCEEEFETIRDFCTHHTVTDEDIKEIESRGYGKEQFLE